MIRTLLALPLLGLASGARADTPSLNWQKWDASLFDRAAREDKYILLHMAAVWCHWCHVMERHHRRRQGRSRRAGAACRRALLSNAISPNRMARPPRGSAARLRHRLSRDAPGRRFRLRQRRLFNPGIRAGSTASSPRSTTD